MQSNWPEHTPEPDEPPPWRGWVIGAAVIVVVAFLLPRDGAWFGAWRAPNISVPQITMPEISMPDLDLRGPSEQPAAISESIDALNEEPSANGEAIRHDVPYETCISTFDQYASALGPPAIIEDTSERRVVRFKVLEGALTITCSRVDGTMTIAQSN